MPMRPEHERELPFPLSDVSNGEWCPRPPTAKQQLAKKMLLEEADVRARRLGMSRRDFLRTAAGTATAFMVLNTVHGLPQTGNAAVLPVSKPHCDDPEVGGQLFSADYFVMDVQLHHVDLEVFGGIPALGCLRFLENTCTPEGLAQLSQANMVKEVFVDSETAVGVVSGVPNGVPMPVETMAQTRDLVNQLAGSERCLSQAMIDPHLPGGLSTALESLDHQVNDLGACAIKTYTGNGNWRLDDEAIAYPMFEAALEHKIRVINVHKGFPQILGGGMGADYVRTIDLPKALEDWPKLKFVVYHSGYFPGPGTTEPIQEFLDVIRSLKRKHRRRLYAEIGSSFAVAFLSNPENAAHLVGALMKELGPKRILWGTDSIWWGSPQWQIDAFKNLQIPEWMQDQFGYPALTDKRKARILGRNAARLYKVRVRQRRCEIEEDQLARIQKEVGGFRKSRTHFAYGPRDKASFEALLAHKGGGVPDPEKLQFFA